MIVWIADELSCGLYVWGTHSGGHLADGDMRPATSPDPRSCLPLASPLSRRPRERLRARGRLLLCLQLGAAASWD
jgi:hypothetical protein